MDSITSVEEQDSGSVVVSGSHGGVSSGSYAVKVPLALAFFNDAGVGKDGAGVVALRMLQEAGIPAACVAHTSARIGDAQDMWDQGIVSHVNSLAKRAGILPGHGVAAAVADFLSRRDLRGGS